MINLTRPLPEPDDLAKQRNSKGSLDSRLGKVLRPILFAMQQGRCAYCEVRLPTKFTIEHFHPDHPDAEIPEADRGMSIERLGPTCRAGNIPDGDNWNLTWDNLFASCDDASDGARSRGCSFVKGNRDLCQLAYKPTELVNRVFTVERQNGELVPIVAGSKTDPKLVSTIEALQLNAPRLAIARKRVIRTIETWANEVDLAELEAMFVAPDVEFPTTMQSIFGSP
jgi:hypothetical protein